MPMVLFLTQSRYAIDLLEHASMKYCKPISLPLSTSHNLRKSASSSSPSPATQYRSTIGALRHLTITRSDLTYAINLVSHFMHSPNLIYEQSVKHILRYRTINFGIRILSQSTMHLYGFYDADWAGCQDTRRSTSRHSMFLGSNCVS